MEYSITWGGDPEDVRFSTRGLCRLLDIRSMTQEAVADPRWREGLNVLIDHTLSDWGAMTAAELNELAQLLGELAQEFGKQRVAVVFGDPESFRAGRLVGLPLDRNVPWLGHAFGSLSEARRWLREPPDQAIPHILPRW